MTTREKIIELAISVKEITDKYDITTTLTDKHIGELKERVKENV